MKKVSLDGSKQQYSSTPTDMRVYFGFFHSQKKQVKAKTSNINNNNN